MILDCDTEGELEMRGNKIGFVILALGAALAFSACNEILHATKGTARVLGHVGSQMLSSSGKIKQTTETTTLELGDWHTLNVQNENAKPDHHQTIQQTRKSSIDARDSRRHAEHCW
jgi:hypothetical protein